MPVETRLGKRKREEQDNKSSQTQQSGDAIKGKKGKKEIGESSRPSQPGDATKLGERMVKAAEHAQMVKIVEARNTWQNFIDKHDENFRKQAEDAYDFYEENGHYGFKAFGLFTPFEKEHGARIASETYNAFQARDKYSEYIQKSGGKKIADAELDKYEIGQESPKQETRPDAPSWLKL